MLTFLATFAGGAGLYLLLCAATALCGRGLLRLGRADIAGLPGWPLAAVVGALFWVLALGVAVGLRLPVRAVAPWLGGASLLLALVGLWRPGRGVLLALACALLPVAALAPTFRAGLTETTETVASDGWAYMAGAEYFGECPRGEPGGHDPVCRFGALLGENRYAGHSLLALLRPLVAPADPFAAVALLQAWSLFVTASAVLLFWLAHGLRPAAALILTTLTATGGWLADVAWCNNLDQGLALPYMPALAAVPALFGPRDARRWGLLAVLLAGLLYTYLELAPFVLAGVGLLSLPRIIAERTHWRALLAGAAAAVLGAVVLLAPARSVYVTFARVQVANARLPRGERPGESLFGGLRRGVANRLWGVGGECDGKPATVAGTTYGWGLTALFAVGLAALARRGQWGVALAAAVLLAAALLVLVGLHYSYGGYKVLSAAWWLTGGVAFAGAGWLLGHVPRPSWRGAGAATAVAVALLLQLRLAWSAAPLWASDCAPGRAAEFRPVRAAAEAAGGRPLLVAVDDWKANLLALFHLRDAPLYLAAYRSHLQWPPTVERLERARAVALAEVGYVLSDDRPESLAWQAAAGPPAWSGGHYRLWPLAPHSGDARLLHAERAGEPFRQLEQRRGRPFVRLSERPTALYVYAARAGRLRLRADFEVSSDLAGGQCRVEVCGPLGDRQELEVGAGEQTLTVPVPAGASRFVVRALGQPAAGPAPTGATVLSVGLASEAEGPAP
jgi:hypothetical protein